MGGRAEALGVEIYPASPRPNSFTAPTAKSSESRPATWEIAATASRRRLHPRHGRCTENTCCSPKAHAARSPSRRSPVSSSPTARAAEIRDRPEGDLAGRASQFQPGLVQHSLGWPLGRGASGGSFEYHYDDGLVSVASSSISTTRIRRCRVRRVPALQDPPANPPDVRRRQAPFLRRARADRRRLAIGAEAVFPGGALVGCAAGFMNVPRIKGSHNAMLSAFWRRKHPRGARRWTQRRRGERLRGLVARFRHRPRPLSVRNVKPLWSKFGLAIGVPCGGLDMITTSGWGCRCSARSARQARTATR